MKEKIFMYRFFFEEEPYYSLTIKQKFLLSILFSLCDEKGYFSYPKKFIQDITNVKREAVRNNLRRLENFGYIKREGVTVKVFLPENVKNKQKIYFHDELIFGKYKYLSQGAKVFYTFHFNEQRKYNLNYINKGIYEIIKPLGQTIFMNHKYFNELESAGLMKHLNRSQRSEKNKLKFIPIEEVPY
ncbi:helix-turn-helix domain-containing protein [Staphylococcus warneri]|uniref:Helix-turn-helix domain-containing protein n=1 Tax=Staphylococcus warneri TaxID=1292 RepID=A0A8B2ZCT9_STAWA|nr:helix-turn-helix domain-containing protein [Staphylococcus warneri]RGM28285.1 helix-turn-helix domain-containing protein [Staphylococcus warneri]